MAHLTPVSYQSIVDRAWSYILDGGGIVPGDAGELEDAIAAVAAAHFESRDAQAALDDALAAVDQSTKRAILETVWRLLGGHADAAFTFGAAVANQLHQVPPAVASTEGGRS